MNKKIVIKNRRLERNKKQRLSLAKKKHINNTINVTRFLLKIFIVLVIIFATIYISIRYIGNASLIVKEYSVDYDNLPDGFYGLKMVQISDLNYDNKTVKMKKIKDLINKVNVLKPDIIVFTGNLVYGDISNKELKNLEDEFSKLDASIGKYAVFGNDDDTIKILMKNAGFMDIENNYDLIYNDNYEVILINGLSSNEYNVDKAFQYFDEKNSNPDIFTITLVHKSDLTTEILEKRNVNMILSGNSLNGQIILPKLGGIIKKDGSLKYYDSYYKINSTDLYISSGIGTGKLPYRLFNHPSINFFRLK